MGLSRRQFTKEFKLAAIQRLEMGASGASRIIYSSSSWQKIFLRLSMCSSPSRKFKSKSTLTEKFVG